MRGMVSPSGQLARSLLLVQAAFGLLATLGIVVLMGFNPVYAVAPVLHATALLVLGRCVARSRRWASATVVVLELLALCGWELQFVLGLLPQLDFTVTLTGLLTTVALPLAVLLLCARQLCAARP